MSKLTPELWQLKTASGLSDVAAVLKVKPSVLAYALYKLPDAAKYRVFKVPKKGGGFRRITAPEPRLAYIQKQLADTLLAIERDLEGARTREECIVAHGFKKQLSIVTNAAVHRNRRFVFNADLKDFFPSINFGRVYGFFCKNRDFALRPEVATVLAQIACHRNELPQGSPCSPVISNFIASILDRHLTKLADKERCTYTRYADDLTFSTNEQEFPARIARLVRGSTDKWVAGDELAGRIARSGFKVNELKTRLQYSNSRQNVTGLVVNNKLNVPSEYYKLVRSMCLHLFKDGSAFIKEEGVQVPISDERVRGKLAHLFHIRGLEIGHKRLQRREQPNYYKLYSRFLDYRSFYGLSQPTIICEGKTDNIYIKTALQMKAASFPGLIEDVDGKLKLRVRFFKYGKASAVLQNLGGGATQLKTLMLEYQSRMAGFQNGALHPVMMVLDVDKGTTQIWTELSKILGTKVAGEDPYYHVFDNLYIVPVPKKPGVETAIEDLFDAATLGYVHDGKTFDKDSDKDKPGTYSKNTFATKVVRDNRSTIDFSGFEPLLKAFEDVQAHYASRVSAYPGLSPAVPVASPVLVP